MHKVVMLATLLPTVGGQIFARFDFTPMHGSYNHRTDDEQHHTTPPPYFNVGVELVFPMLCPTLLLMTATNIEIGGAGLSVLIYKS